MASQNTAKESQNKENIDEFRDFILEQKPTNTKVKTQSDMKAWKQLRAINWLSLPVLKNEQAKIFDHIINPLLTKLVRSRWLDIGQVLFLRYMD